MENTAPPTIFNKRRRAAKWTRMVRRHKTRNAASYLLDDAIADVVERLEFIQFAPENALVIGDWTERLRAHLSEQGATVRGLAIGEMDEARPFETQGFDCIVHFLGLGSVNDLPGALIHIRNALKPGGVFIAAFPGAGSLQSLRRIMVAGDRDTPAARIHPMVDQKAGAALMQRAGFKRQVVDSHTIRVRYSSLDTLISDLRDHGLTNALQDSGPAITKTARELAYDKFNDMTDIDGKLEDKFEMITLTGWK